MKYICDHVSIMFIHVLVQINVQLPSNFVYIQLYVNKDLTLPYCKRKEKLYFQYSAKRNSLNELIKAMTRFFSFWIYD